MADEERGHAEEFAAIRADAPLTPEQALAMAPDAQEQRFSVPRILAED